MAATRSAELAAVPAPRGAARTGLDVAVSVLKHAVLLLFGLSFLLPFWWMVATSLKPDQAMFHIPPLLVPFQDLSTWDRLVWDNYPRAFTFTRPPFYVFIWNTL